MNDSTNSTGISLYNLVDNVSLRQKIGIGVGVVIVILVIILMFVVFASNDDAEDVGDEIVEETYVDENGYTVTAETYINADGEEVVTGTKEDPYGNVTTLDPELITTYFPYQVVREHNEWWPTLRYFLSVDERGKKINAMIEYCDIEGDKALVEQYINNIPLDLSEFSVEYEIFETDASCGD